MKSMSVLYEMLIAKGESFAQARVLCRKATESVHQNGKFEVACAGGWLFGHLSNHGIVVGQ